MESIFFYMKKKSLKTVFCCQLCGHQVPKWMGRCPECGEWQTMIEETCTTRAGQSVSAFSQAMHGKPVPIDSIEIEDEQRILTGIGEFDRVLGGGLVHGSLILIGGNPGIGKSTLMLQVLHSLTQNGEKVLYVSGEESIRQIKLRSKRLSAVSSDLLVVSEIDVESILSMLKTCKPHVLVIDSIQTMYNSELASAPGSVSQVRESAVKLMIAAKSSNVPIFIVGHVTKDGAIAGPRILEHMVDTVLYFEGDKDHIFRILRAVKNRFGSTNEIGVFEMNEGGLDEVVNPSALFLSERPENSAGSIVTATMEGTRPVLVEIQALVSSTGFGAPRRTVAGIDRNRVSILAAVVEKKLEMQLMEHDIFMNTAGGVKLYEPAADLAIICAIVSSFLNKKTVDETIIVGEVGLTGEVRGVSFIEIRIAEAEKMGFTRCIIPKSSLKRVPDSTKMEVCGTKNISDAIEFLF